uniref:Uncharacterized protein n=1 Tax=Anguilla anguilla TaxID=7936 RepID=A0A0E9SKS5_ANGAN
MTTLCTGKKNSNPQLTNDSTLL